MVDRWHALLPDHWAITRDVDAQITAFARRIHRFCKCTPNPTPATIGLDRALDAMAQAGREPNRHNILAEVATLRTVALPQQIAQLVFVVQSQFFGMGTEIHRGCTFYPGRFTHTARSTGMPVDVLPLPPMAWEAEPQRLKARLQQIGIDAAGLLSLPAQVLFEIASSAPWRRLRGLLVAEYIDPSLVREVAAMLEQYADATDALGRLSEVLGPTPAAPLLPAPWQLAIHATLAAVVSEQPACIASSQGEVVLDLDTLRLVGPGEPARPVAPAHAYLLAVLAAVGEAGLSSHEVKQLTLDTDRIDVCGDEQALGPWKPQVREPATLSRTRADRIRQLKSRANGRLAPFGLRIVTRGRKGHGRWILEDATGGDRRLRLRGTSWELLGKGRGIHEEPPPVLSEQHEALWRLLAGVSPRAIPVALIARWIGKATDEVGTKQVIDTLDRFADRLDEGRAGHRVQRVQRGLYRLVPRGRFPRDPVTG